MPECTVWQAATTGGIPAKYSCQPALPYAAMPRFHIKLLAGRRCNLGELLLLRTCSRVAKQLLRARADNTCSHA